MGQEKAIIKKGDYSKKDKKILLKIVDLFEAWQIKELFDFIESSKIDKEFIGQELRKILLDVKYGHEYRVETTSDRINNWLRFCVEKMRKPEMRKSVEEDLKKKRKQKDKLRRI